MKLSRVIANSEAARTGEIAAPSAVHVAMVEVLGELTNMAVKTGHPTAKIMRSIIPSLLPDIAEIPTDVLSQMARRLGELMLRVADAELNPPPSLAELMEAAERDTQPRPALAPSD